jgi:glycosyltransferase 2 family protein
MGSFTSGFIASVMIENTGGIGDPINVPPGRHTPPRHSRFGRKGVLFVGKLLLSVALLAILMSRVDLRAMLGKFVNLNWSWLIAGVTLQQAQILMSTVKWQVLLKAEGQRLRFFFLWKTYLIGSFLSLFLPSSFGGDIYRVWALNRAGTKTSKSAASVIFDRLSGLLALTTIGMFGALMVLSAAHAFLIFMVYSAGVLVCAILTSDRTITRLGEPTSKYLGFPFRVLRSFNLYRRTPGTLLRVIIISVLFQANVVVIVTCYARALRIDPAAVTFFELVAVVPVVFLLEALPISINGIGVREGAFVFLLSRVGGTAEQGLALSVLIIVIRYIQGLLGGTLLLLDALRHERASGITALGSPPAQRGPGVL